jgi:hypothetical protein
MLQLNQEITDKITNIEKMKRCDSDMEEKLKRAFGIYKTRDELLGELVKDWLGWEPSWTNKINLVIQQVKDEKTCFTTASEVYLSTYQILDYYQKYRQEALDEKGRLKETLLPSYLTNPLMIPAEFKRRLLEGLENELALKINHDLTARVEKTVTTYQKCLGNQSMANEIWADLKNSVTDYLTILKQELNNYAQEDLFLEPAAEGKKKKELYDRLGQLIDLTADLVDKFGLRLADTTNKKLESDTHERIELINQKARDLFAK